VNNNGDAVIDGIYGNFSQGEIDTTDVLSPSEIAGQAATNYSSTGYYGFAAAELAALGNAGSLNHSHTVERYNGETLDGTLFYTGQDSVTFSLDDTYDPADYSGSFLMATNDGIVELTRPFTITDQVNTRTDETVGNVDAERYVYDRTSADQFKEALDQLQQVRQSFEDSESRATGIGISGDGFLGDLAGALGLSLGVTLVVLVALIAVAARVILE
jgi:hypothetical protein